MVKRALLLGGTGAIGIYLAPELSKRGFKVDITSRSPHKSSDKSVAYLQGNARDDEFLQKVLTAKKYDVIVDFMIYSTDEFKNRHNLLLQNCKQYIFLSSYRVFADDDIITEKSPRLLDVLTDKEYLATDEYALAKARQEDILRRSKRKNWTIVRPAVTYSSTRFQLGTLEADTVVYRSLNNLPVIIPKEMMSKTTTMTWAGDVARFISKLALNQKALGEDFNIATTENHTWADVAKIYKTCIGLKLKTVSLHQYIEAQGEVRRYQVMYDRMYDRVLNNSKVLSVVGEKQENLKSLQDGLRMELDKFVKNPHFSNIDYVKQARIDRLTRTIPNFRLIPGQYRKLYFKNRFPLLMHIASSGRKIRPRTRLKNGARRFRQFLRPRSRIRESIRAIKSYRNRHIVRDNIAHLNTINSKPDGAILTLIDYSNYGNILQRFALQKFLYNNGYKFTSYEHSLPKNSDLSEKKYNRIADFVNRYIARTGFTGKDEFPAYITGSDQVWRNWTYDDEYKDLGFFFFNFVRDPNKKLIAYAISFGQDSARSAGLSEGFVKKIKPYVQKISHVSAREKAGAKAIKNEWGVDAELTVDPTLLLTPEEYGKIIYGSADRRAATANVFAYILRANEHNMGFVDRIEQEVHKITQRLLPYMQDDLPSVAYWLKSIRDAELVVTDSFHCTVFAILSNTPFVVISDHGWAVSRLEHLLKEFGISDRLVMVGQANGFSVSKLKPIDWDMVNRRLEKKRTDSGSWLLNGLNE